MKRHSNLPDFSKLCAPEQNSIQDAVSLLIHFFFLGSFWGFLWETLIFIAKDNTFHNRGFFYGPWLPVYGIGAVVFYCLFHSSRETISIRSLHKSNRLFLFKTKYHPLTIFIKTALLGTALELVITDISAFCQQSDLVLPACSGSACFLKFSENSGFPCRQASDVASTVC